MKIFVSTRFLRDSKRIPKEARKDIEKAVATFVIDPHHPTLRTHKLAGALHGLWSFSVTYRLRIIFEFLDSTHVRFHNIGDHSIYDER